MLDALVAAGATAASYAPDATDGRTGSADVSSATVVEDPELQVHEVQPDPWRPASAAFLSGLQRWQVVAYDGIVPIVQAWVAAAVRRRGPDRRLRAVHESGRELVITFPDRLRPAVRAALEASQPDMRALSAEHLAQPAQALTAARHAVDAERSRVERLVGERWLENAPPREWLVVDGLLSEHAHLGAHRRALGLIRSHGALGFTGPEQERALTLSAGCRTSVFQPAARGSAAVYSWYLRLWPWEGHDLLYGLIRVEAPAGPRTIERVGHWSSWLLAERAPLAASSARWDRLVYPLHDVETYLRARAPRDIMVSTPQRFPVVGGSRD